MYYHSSYLGLLMADILLFMHQLFLKNNYISPVHAGYYFNKMAIQSGTLSLMIIFLSPLIHKLCNKRNHSLAEIVNDYCLAIQETNKQKDIPCRKRRNP